MQDCEFSETQFSFCFTFEYIKKWFPVIPLPIFPNTYDEGQEGGGYDVRILGNIFFQFKIPPVYYDKVNNFFRLHWDVFGQPYYKIRLDTNHKQFRLLKDLDIPGNEVFYATPEFHLASDLEKFYNGNLIEHNSAIFPIAEFPAPGSGHHHLIYSARSTSGYLFSEPAKIEKVRSINLRELFPRANQQITIYEQAKRLVGQIDLGEKTILPRFELDRPDLLVKQVYSHLLIYYDVHWYPVVDVDNLPSNMKQES